MNHTLIIFGIQATLRAAQAGADLYKEHARDRNVFLPNLKLPDDSRFDILYSFLNDNKHYTQTEAVFSKVWNKEIQNLGTEDKKLIDDAFAHMLKIKALQELRKENKVDEEAEHEAIMLAGGRMVEQWREERKPPSAFVRMALTLTDIGLEFVSSNPTLFGIGNSGEKLVVSFANNMSKLIPNDVAEFGQENTFANRLVGIFLRAGLSSLSSNPSMIFSDDDVANLFQGIAKPIVDTLPETIHEQMNYREMIDVLAGPSAQAAFKIIAENPENYLGKKYNKDQALGAVTTALFETIRDITGESSIVHIFSEQGMIRIYQSGLNVAVNRPELFIGQGDAPEIELYKDLLRGTAETLAEYPRFNGPLGASLAAMVIETVGENAPSILKFNHGEPWEKIADQAIKQVTNGLAEAVRNYDSNGLYTETLGAFSDDQLLELCKVILAQVAKTPGMLGVKNIELQNVIAGIAEVMAKDDNLLLSSDEWIIIARVATEKAAANPGRLFGISSENEANAIAVTVIGSILNVASDAWNSEKRSGKSLLFGKTLQAVLIEVIEAMGGNLAGLYKQPDIVGRFFKDLISRASDTPEKFGSDSILKIVQSLISSVLAEGVLPANDKIDKILSS